MKKTFPKKVIYQTGVDILGFPIYQEHHFFNVKGFFRRTDVLVKEVRRH